MAAFSLSADTNIDALSGKAGGDTYDTNGFILTIDQDSRVGTNQTTSTTLGSITINATKGGKCNIVGTAIRLIAYTSGSGNVPAWNTVITQSGQTGSGKLIGIHSALTAASTATGAAMPASGYIRLKQVTGTYASGALTGITATSSGADTVGWLEIVGDEASTVNANRLGEFNVTGAWYSIGTTNGSSNQTMQIPNNGLLRYAAGVFIEKTAGQADYEFYPNAGTTTTTGTEATRGKVVWIDNTGLVRIGNSGAATNGYTPVTGLAVVIGNVFLENCTTAARTANVIPNATIATRYDFTTTGGGVVNIDKCNAAWYLSFSQPFSVTLTNTGTIDGLLLSECASAITWSKVGVGNKPTTALLMSALTMTLDYAGGTLTDCVWARVSQAASGAYTITLTDIEGFTFITNTIRANTIRGNATVYSIFATRIVNCTWTNPTIIQSAVGLTTCNGVTFTDTIYCDAVSGVTVTTYVMYIWTLFLNTLNCTFNGLTFPVANTPPYSALLNLGVAGCSNIKLRNIGTYASPLPLGSATVFTGGIIVIAASASATDIKVQRVYCSNTRLNGIYYVSATSPDNSSTRITFENVFTDYADGADLNNMLNLTRKGIGGIPALTAATSIYGTHFFDCHTSTTAGRIVFIMNETTSLTSSQVALSGGAAFTSTGGLYMPTIGQIAIFTMPDYIIGHTGFTNTAGVMAGGTATNYTYRYQIDKNNGNGFSAWSASKTATTLGTALNSEASISAINGFKLKLEITTGTTNTTAITSFYLVTTSTTTTQAYQYSLDLSTITLTNVVVGSMYEIYDITSLTTLATGTAGSSTVNITAVASNNDTIRIRVRKASTATKYIPFETQTTIANLSASVYVSQIADLIAA